MFNVERLFHVLSSLHPLTENFKEAIQREITPLSLPKHYVLQEASEVSKYIYFINHGYAASYTYREGVKAIEWLWKPEEVIVSPRSFFERTASVEFIELLTKSELLCIPHEGMMRLFRDFPEMESMYRSLINRYYELSRDRIREMRHLKSVERYRKLLRSCRNIQQILPQDLIASYLGITPQSLCRIKRNTRYAYEL
jgi:CRP-like cAMP-binding protein